MKVLNIVVSNLPGWVSKVFCPVTVVFILSCLNENDRVLRDFSMQAFMIKNVGYYNPVVRIGLRLGRDVNLNTLPSKSVERDIPHSPTALK